MELIIALVLFVAMISVWMMMPNNDTVSTPTEVEVIPVYQPQTQS